MLQHSLNDPYELVYRGDILEGLKEKEMDEEKVERDNERQIYDLTNIIRDRFHMKLLKWDVKTAKVAIHIVSICM